MSAIGVRIAMKSTSRDRMNSSQNAGWVTHDLTGTQKMYSSHSPLDLVVALGRSKFPNLRYFVIAEISEVRIRQHEAHSGSDPLEV